MRVDFYVLENNPAEKIIANIAAKVLATGERLLVVEPDADRRAAISKALWEMRPADFLANGDAADPLPDCQPILLSDALTALNGAKMLCLADGEWRESEGFERVFYLFGDDKRPAARQQWTRLAAMDGVENRFWKQVNGRWVEGP